MQVITGKFKGRKLSTVPDLSVRPATHRVKSAIFNILQSRVHWSSATVLDLYAGSGSIGIEALSRGATHVTFVENDKRVADFLKKNITKIGATNECDILLLSVEQFLERPRQSFDVIFVDPPYALQTLSSLPLTIFQKNLVRVILMWALQNNMQ